MRARGGGSGACTGLHIRRLSRLRFAGAARREGGGLTDTVVWEEMLCVRNRGLCVRFAMTS